MVLETISHIVTYVFICDYNYMSPRIGEECQVLSTLTNVLRCKHHIQLCVIQQTHCATVCGFLHVYKSYSSNVQKQIYIKFELIKQFLRKPLGL